MDLESMNILENNRAMLAITGDKICAGVPKYHSSIYNPDSRYAGGLPNSYIPTGDALNYVKGNYEVKMYNSPKQNNLRIVNYDRRKNEDCCISRYAYDENNSKPTCGMDADNMCRNLQKSSACTNIPFENPICVRRPERNPYISLRREEMEPYENPHPRTRTFSQQHRPNNCTETKNNGKGGLSTGCGGCGCCNGQNQAPGNNCQCGKKPCCGQLVNGYGPHGCLCHCGVTKHSVLCSCNAKYRRLMALKAARQKHRVKRLMNGMDDGGDGWYDDSDEFEYCSDDFSEEDKEAFAHQRSLKYSRRKPNPRWITETKVPFSHYAVTLAEVEYKLRHLDYVAAGKEPKLQYKNYIYERGQIEHKTDNRTYIDVNNRSESIESIPKSKSKSEGPSNISQWNENTNVRPNSPNSTIKSKTSRKSQKSISTINKSKTSRRSQKSISRDRKARKSKSSKARNNSKNISKNPPSSRRSRSNSKKRQKNPTSETTSTKPLTDPSIQTNSVSVPPFEKRTPRKSLFFSVNPSKTTGPTYTGISSGNEEDEKKAPPPPKKQNKAVISTAGPPKPPAISNNNQKSAPAKQNPPDTQVVAPHKKLVVSNPPPAKQNPPDTQVVAPQKKIAVSNPPPAKQNPPETQVVAPQKKIAVSNPPPAKQNPPDTQVVAPQKKLAVSNPPPAKQNQPPNPIAAPPKQPVVVPKDDKKPAPTKQQGSIKTPVSATGKQAVVGKGSQPKRASYQLSTTTVQKIYEQEITASDTEGSEDQNSKSKPAKLTQGKLKNTIVRKTYEQQMTTTDTKGSEDQNSKSKPAKLTQSKSIKTMKKLAEDDSTGSDSYSESDDSESEGVVDVVIKNTTVTKTFETVSK